MLQFSATVTKKFWVLTRDQFDEVSDQIPVTAIVDASKLEIPSSVNAANLVVVDKCVRREKLGLGVAELEMAIKESLSMPPAGGVVTAASQMTPAAQNACSSTEVVQRHEDSGPQHAPGFPAAPTLRVLEREVSEEGDLDASLETMAKKIREPFDKQQFVCTDRMNPHSVQYWLGEFVKHVEDAKWTAGNEPTVAMLFVRFVVKRMLGSPCFDELNHFTAMLARLQTKAPQLVPSTISVLLALSEDKALEAEELRWGDMPLGARTTFVESTLYQQFLRKRACRQFLTVRGARNMCEEEGPCVPYEHVLDMFARSLT